MLTMFKPSMKARNSVCVTPWAESEGAQARVKASPPPGMAWGIAIGCGREGMLGGGVEACL